jgi:putative transposase
VTRYRRKILNSGVREYLETKLREARKYYPDWEYVAIGIAEDHIHLHRVIPPKYAVSMVVETLKENTSRELCQKFRFLKQVYWDNEGIWSKGFFVATVGINEAIIRKYVQQQEKEDTGLKYHACKGVGIYNEKVTYGVGPIVFSGFGFGTGPADR